MATFGAIQERVRNLLKRNVFYAPDGTDVTTTAVPAFVNFALTAIQRFIVIKQAVEVTTSFTIGPSNHPYNITTIAPPMRYEYDLWASSAGLSGTAAAPLKRYTDIRSFHRDFPPIFTIGTTTATVPGAPLPGPPRAFVIFNNQINLGPTPDLSYTFVLDYVQTLPALVNAADTNWFTINADDAVTYLACGEAAAWLQEDQLLQLYTGPPGNDPGAMPGGLAGAKIRQVLRTLREEEVAEGDLTAQLWG